MSSVGLILPTFVDIVRVVCIESVRWVQHKLVRLQYIYIYIVKGHAIISLSGILQFTYWCSFLRTNIPIQMSNNRNWETIAFVYHDLQVTYCDNW